MTWKKLTENHCSQWKLTTDDTQERNTWRLGVRSAMHAAIASYLESGPIDVDDALPLHLHINHKSDYDNMGCENIALSTGGFHTGIELTASPQPSVTHVYMQAEGSYLPSSLSGPK